MPYPAYQCFKTQSRDVYCSSYIVKNHDEGRVWIARALEHYELQANELKGKPYTSIEANIPDDANRL